MLNIFGSIISAARDSPSEKVLAASKCKKDD